VGRVGRSAVRVGEEERRRDADLAADVVRDANGDAAHVVDEAPEGAQRAELERLVAAPTTPQRLVKRARIVLLRAEGCTQWGTAAQAGVSRPAVIRWERRFAGLGLAGLEDAVPSLHR